MDRDSMDQVFKKLPTDDMNHLRNWITANDATRYDHQHEGSLRLEVTHSNLQMRFHDILLHREMTVFRVKEKLYHHCGTGCGDAEVYLRRGFGGSDTILLYDDRKTLADYGAQNGMELFIKDTNPHSLSANGGLEDVSLVEKYMISEEDYDKRANTVRRQKAAAMEKKKAEAAARAAACELGEGLEPCDCCEEDPAEVAALFPLGSRCEVSPGGRRGELAFVGRMKGVKGVWLGVRLDEPQGRNDGTKDGVCYFEARPGYGCFAKTENVKVGDFPERDPFASDDDEDEF